VFILWAEKLRKEPRERHLNIWQDQTQSEDFNYHSKTSEDFAFLRAFTQESQKRSLAAATKHTSTLRISRSWNTTNCCPSSKKLRRISLNIRSTWAKSSSRLPRTTKKWPQDTVWAMLSKRDIQLSLMPWETLTMHFVWFHSSLTSHSIRVSRSKVKTSKWPNAFTKNGWLTAQSPRVSRNHSSALRESTIKLKLWDKTLPGLHHINSIKSFHSTLITRSLELSKNSICIYSDSLTSNCSASSECNTHQLTFRESVPTYLQTKTTWTLHRSRLCKLQLRKSSTCNTQNQLSKLESVKNSRTPLKWLNWPRSMNRLRDNVNFSLSVPSCWIEKFQLTAYSIFCSHLVANITLLMILKIMLLWSTPITSWTDH